MLMHSQALEFEYSNLDGHRLNTKADNFCGRVLSLNVRVIVILNNDTDVVVQVVLEVARYSGMEADWVASAEDGFVQIICSKHANWQVVNDPVNAVVVINGLNE